MLNLKIGTKELKVKFGYEATLKTRLLSRVAKKQVTVSDGADDNIEKIEDMLLFLPEILLIGLQKFHADEYGFNYENSEKKEEQIGKMFALIEEYCDEDEKDAAMLFNELEEELMSDGFLASMFRQEKSKAEQKQPKAKN